MIKIGDTGLLEGLPPGIAEQHWVKVIDAVYRERLKKELKVIERIHVYTAIDSLPEDLLDVLAVQFKVDWYRDDYPVETKRRVIKTAMEVRRYCGTEWAVKQAISAIYPNSEIVEWYDYGGTPGHWRLRVNITENADISYYTIKRMEDLLGYARRCTAHLEGISYLIFNDTTTAYVGAGYHGTTQRVAVPIAGTLRPRELLSTTYAKAGVWHPAAGIGEDHRNPAAEGPQGCHIRPGGLRCYTDADDSLHQRKYSPGGSQGNNLGSGGHCCIQAAN